MTAPRLLRRALAACALALALVPAAAFAAGPALNLPQLTEAQLAAYEAHAEAADDAVAARDYAKAAREFQKALAIDGSSEGNWYNLACVQSLMGRPTLALVSLRKALDAGWADAAWPAKDSDLTPLHEDAEFLRWLEDVKKAAELPKARPAFAAGDLGTSAEQIEELADAANAAFASVRPVLGASKSRRTAETISLWKAASWDALAAASSDATQRAEAEWSAVSSLVGKSLEPVMPDLAAEVLRRATEFATLHPESARATDARYVAATARRNKAWADATDPEAVETEIGPAYTRELLVIAGTSSAGRGLELALARLVQEHEDDLAVAGLFHRRLRALVADDAKFASLMMAEARGVHYRLEGLPEFSATTLDGRGVSPKELAGKVTLLDFWATWCGPCRAELPHLKEAYAKYKDRGFEIIGISLDRGADGNPEAFNAWCAENGVTWPQVFDGKFWEAAVAKSFGVKSIPFPLLVGRDGKVAFADSQLRGEMLLQRIESLLEAPAGL